MSVFCSVRLRLLVRLVRPDQRAPLVLRAQRVQQGLPALRVRRVLRAPPVLRVPQVQRGRLDPRALRARRAPLVLRVPQVQRGRLDPRVLRARRVPLGRLVLRALPGRLVLRVLRARRGRLALRARLRLSPDLLVRLACRVTKVDCAITSVPPLLLARRAMVTFATTTRR